MHHHFRCAVYVWCAGLMVMYCSIYIGIVILLLCVHAAGQLQRSAVNMVTYVFRDLVNVQRVPTGAESAPAVGEELSFFWILLSLLALAVVFHAIYVVCDEHLVPGECASFPLHTFRG